MPAGAPVDVGSLIVSTPGVQGGQPCLAGTRIRAITVAIRYREGESPEFIAEDMDVPLSHVHAAIAYYLANRERVDTEIAEEEALYDRLEAESRAERQSD